MQFKFSLQPIINILYIFLGIILPPCLCCTGEYKSLFKFLVFYLSGVVSSKPLHELHMLPATCILVQNDELKQAIHRYRGVVINAVKIFLISFLIFSFRSLIHWK